MNDADAVSVIALIDIAAKQHGDYSKLARALRIEASTLRQVREGKRGLTQEACTRLGLETGVSPERVWYLNGLERESDPGVKEWLRRALFTVAVLGVVLPLQTLDANAIESAYGRGPLNIHCRALLRALRFALRALLLLDCSPAVRATRAGGLKQA